MRITNVVTNKILKFDGQDIDDSIMSDDGSTVSVAGNVTLTAGSFVNKYTTSRGYIAHPYNAFLSINSSNQTGAIKIKLPVIGQADMISFVVDIFDYGVDKGVTLFIKGYQYQGVGQNTWVNCTVQNIASDEDYDYTVRFGDDGTDACVWIGETSKIWQ